MDENGKLEIGTKVIFNSLKGGSFWEGKEATVIGHGRKKESGYMHVLLCGINKLNAYFTEMTLVE